MTTEAFPSGGSAANHVEIDLPTGLPKLSIELLPEEDKPQRKHTPFLDQAHIHRLGLNVLPSDMAARVSAVRVATVYNTTCWFYSNVLPLALVIRTSACPCVVYQFSVVYTHV